MEGIEGRWRKEER
jgi:hypothetical protein